MSAHNYIQFITHLLTSGYQYFCLQGITNEAPYPVPEARLMTAVTAIPYQVYGKICLKLNIRRLLFDDFRILGEKVGLTRDEVEYLGQQDNPTDHILRKWSSTGQATVKKFMDVLGEEGLERNDVIEILKNWVGQ